MNIFLPFPENIKKSIQCLDDRRLIKQILETKQILRAARKEVKGYVNHPIVKHYANQQSFLIYFGFECCNEYLFRFAKEHAYYEFFRDELCNTSGKITLFPVYVEGSFQTTDSFEVAERYKRKLKDKWDNDKNPKWTRRRRLFFTKKEFKS